MKRRCRITGEKSKVGSIWQVGKVSSEDFNKTVSVYNEFLENEWNDFELKVDKSFITLILEFIDSILTSSFLNCAALLTCVIEVKMFLSNASKLEEKFWGIGTAIIKEGIVDSYNFALFPVPRLFSLTLDIVYLFAFLLDSCG
ncbi:hypothetical protein STEG23_031120 [Scotinomys teguina]